MENTETLLVIIITTIFLTEVTSLAQRTYRAAVYEHDVILPDQFKIVNRDQAVELMKKNLDVFEHQTREAKSQGADIIVFPENGIYGFLLTRDVIYSYLEPVPDPKNVTWSPCQDPGRYGQTDVQYALSCMARNNSIYLVANMGAKEYCDAMLDPKCPFDGRYQYNTAVAFGPDGTLLARYYKANLFAEPAFDEPEPERIYFDTPFGRFGLTICFDALFYEPLVALVTEHNVTNIVMPTAWMDALPLLSAIGFHSSLARGLGVNLLSANLHIPTSRFQGSGVYSPEGMKGFYYNNTLLSEGKLVVADVNVIKQPIINQLPESLLRKDHTETLEAALESFAGKDVSPNTQTKANTNMFTIKKKPHASYKFIGDSIGSYDDEFYSELFGDMFTFKKLTGISGSLNVCQGKVCCNLNYTTENTTDVFAFGAFDGLHTKEGHYYFQICALVKCAYPLNQSSCGEVTFTSQTSFSKLEMNGVFQTKYIYPQVMLSRKSKMLALAKTDQWTFENGQLSTSSDLIENVLSAALYGRDYTRDDGRIFEGEACSLATRHFVDIFSCCIVIINLFIKLFGTSNLTMLTQALK